MGQPSPGSAVCWLEDLPNPQYGVGEVYSIPFPDPPLTLNGIKNVAPDDPLRVYISARLMLGLLVGQFEDPDALWLAPMFSRDQLGEDFDELYERAQAGALPPYLAVDGLPHLDNAPRVVLLTAPQAISRRLLERSKAELLEAMTPLAAENVRVAMGALLPK